MKKRTLNEYRQTKEYKLSDQGGESDFKALKERIDSKLEECHQKLWGESYYNDPSDQGGEFKDVEFDDLEDTKEKKLKKLEEAHKIPEEIEKIQEELERDYIEEAKIEIVEKIVKHLDDIIFEKVCNEMGKRHVFQSQNYLTEAGMDEFEDQWFEFYHEHHGDILAAIHNKLIY